MNRRQKRLHLPHPLNKIIQGATISMNHVLKDYNINLATCALLPAKEITYDTIVIEQDKKLFVKKPALQLIQEACIRYGATYDGIITATNLQTGYFKKVPISISIARAIYAFPTHAIENYDCAWIFPKHIQSIHSIAAANQNGKAKSFLVFNNNLKLPLTISYYVLDKQLRRTQICQSVFTSDIENYTFHRLGEDKQIKYL